MKTKSLTAIALMLAVLPVAGFAQGGPQAGAARPAMPAFDFAAADTDSSGGISLEEWTAYTTALRDTMRSERLGARADALLEAGDADGDGLLSRDELIASLGARGDEMRGQMQDRRGERGSMMGQHQRPHGSRGGDCDHDGHRGADRGQGRGQQTGPQDGSGPRAGQQTGPQDGSGPRAGQQAGPQAGQPGAMGERFFSRIDRDGDGQISAEELEQAQAFMQRMGERRQGPANN